MNNAKEGAKCHIGEVVDFNGRLDIIDKIALRATTGWVYGFKNAEGWIDWLYECEIKKAEGFDKKPITNIHLKLTGTDGNAFSIMGRARQALRAGGRADLVEVYTKAATAGDYNNLLKVTSEFLVIH